MPGFLSSLHLCQKAASIFNDFAKNTEWLRQFLLWMLSKVKRNYNKEE